MTVATTFDKTLKKMCRKKINDPSAPLLSETFTVQEAISEAVIRKALGGASDAVKIIREILNDEVSVTPDSFRIDINVVE